MLDSQQKNVLNQAYIQLSRVLGAIHWGTYGSQLAALIRKEEREHRGGCIFSGQAWGLSIADSVKLFFVQDILDGLETEKKYSLKDFLHVRQSVLFAHSLAENYRVELEKALQGVDLAAIRALDYAELVK